MKNIRVFFAHPAGMSGAEIDTATGDLQSLLHRRSKQSLTAHVVPGRDDHKLHFKGDWDAWARSIVSRKDTITLKRYYDIIIVPNETVGRATAQIVEAAFAVGRPVILFVEGTLRKVVGIYQHDPEDWQGGFTLELWEPPAKKPAQLELPLEVSDVRNSY